MAIPHPVYRGLYTSLYDSLPIEAINDIERAILAKICGQADDARAIFENELEAYRNTPVVILECADLEFETGRWGAAWRILSSKLRELKEADADLDLPEHRLMALTWAMLGTRHRGDLASAAHEIERAQAWLRDVPVVEYTDIQASCIRRYVIASLFIKLSSNYGNGDIELIPRRADNISSSEGELNWPGLGQLRRHLTTSGMIYEANALFRVELNRTPLENREHVINEFLEAVAKHSSFSSRQYVEASVRLQWGTSYVLLGNQSRAEEEMTISENLFKKYCEELKVADIFQTPHLQALRYERLSLIQDPVAKLTASEMLADELESIQSYKTGMCLSDTADLAKLFYQYMADITYLEKFFGLQKRLEMYDETVSEDLCDLVLHRNDLSSLASTQLVDRQKSLEWIDGFFQRYHYFQSPAEISSLYRRRAILLQGLRRLEEADLANKLADELDTSGPTLGKWLHMGAINKSLPLQQSEIETFEYGSDDEGAETPFWTPWETAMGDAVKTKDKAVELVLEWSLEDLVSGHITVKDFGNMVDEPDIEITDDDSPGGVAVIAKLRDDHVKNFTSIMFPADTISDLRYKQNYNHIFDWLVRFPTGQRDKRLFCLLMLRDARQSHFCDLQLWSLRIQEFKILLDLFPKLPRHIREFFPTIRGTWLGALAQTYLAPLDQVSDFRDNKIADAISKAESYNNAAIHELRQRYHPGEMAIQSRCGAQICMLKLVRIRQSAMDVDLANGMVPDDEKKLATDDTPKLETESEHQTGSYMEINAIRKTGLEKLRETDSIHTESELSASWIGGLEGITERQKVLLFQGSFHTTYVAINLLLEEVGGLTSDTITAIWNWVQKYKARSLARTIGVQASDPPGLIAQIKASAKAGPAYERLLSLEKQIEEATSSARFHLRRQLDVHRNDMKKTDDLLRQLIDLREGTPLGIADIATIQVKTKDPLLLVDWFYLPPFVQGDSGRLLLLTAKAGLQPTLDILQTTMEDIDNWQKQFLAPETYNCVPEENLREWDARLTFDNLLGGLIEPLSHRSRPGDILVLCPSKTLHRLPLHALSLETHGPKQDNHRVVESLIHRNPVVYIHSHSLLRSCFSATEHARHDPAVVNAQFLSGIPESRVRYHDTRLKREFDYSQGRESIINLAGWFDSDPMLDATASKLNLMKMIGQSRLLHLHTHCMWDQADPLDHHIELPHFEGLLPSHAGQVSKLTTREVFDIRVLPGTHFNVIACQGGVYEVKQGDEVMGLIPALLYSGASSTVSTLWSIDDEDGAEFSFHFFDSFLEQCGGDQNMEQLQDSDVNPGNEQSSVPQRSCSTFIDIAKAVQTAVKKMDEGQLRPLYHWAAFVLHGFWEFPLSRVDAKWLQERA